MQDYTIRALRTFVQTFIGTLSSVGLFNAIADTGVLPGWNTFAQVGLMAAASALTAVLAFTQNYLEDRNDLQIMVK